MKQRKATRVQRVMIALMAVGLGALLLWAIPEVIGVVSPAAEDTYSEWVWDLPFGAMIAISILHLIAGILFVWSAGHFVEGYRRRKPKE